MFNKNQDLRFDVPEPGPGKGVIDVQKRNSSRVSRQASAAQSSEQRLVAS
jgi:hypothetical protein